MFEFDSNGFLTPRIYEFEAGLEESYGDFLSRARRINCDCHELLFEADVRNRDLQHLIIVALFLRVLEHYQATIILLSKGLIGPSKSSLRSLLEATFITRNVALGDEATTAYINTDLVERKKQINKALNNDYDNFRELRDEITQEIVSNIDDKIEHHRAKKLSIEEQSKRAGMHDWYTTLYSHLSQSAHTSVRELESYLIRDESGEVQSFRYAPGLKEVPHLTLYTAHLVLLSASAVDQTLEVGFKDRRDEHMKFIDSAFRALNKEPS